MKKKILSLALAVGLVGGGCTTHQPQAEYDLTEPWLYTVEFVGEHPTDENVFDESVQEFLRVDSGLDVAFENIGDKSNDIGQASYHVIVTYNDDNLTIGFD